MWFKDTRTLNKHYSPIIHVCMHTQQGRDKFKNFQILLDSACMSTIVTRMLITKLNPK